MWNVDMERRRVAADVDTAVGLYVLLYNQLRQQNRLAPIKSYDIIPANLQFTSVQLHQVSFHIKLTYSTFYRVLST